MREFFVGLWVVLLLLILSVVAILLLPVIVVLGFFLKCLLSVLFVIVGIWLVGKCTLLTIDYLKKNAHSDHISS